MIRHDPRVIPLRTGYHNLCGSRVERRHLAQVPDQQAPIGDGGERSRMSEVKRSESKAASGEDSS